MRLDHDGRQGKAKVIGYSNSFVTRRKVIPRCPSMSIQGFLASVPPSIISSSPLPSFGESSPSEPTAKKMADSAKPS